MIDARLSVRDELPSIISEQCTKVSYESSGDL